MQFTVATSPCVTTVLGSASASHVERDIAWISEPIDADLLAEVEAILAPARDVGWSAAGLDWVCLSARNRLGTTAAGVTTTCWCPSVNPVGETAA